LNSLESSPNNFILNNQKRNTLDSSTLKPDENEHLYNINPSNMLVTKETVLNGQTKTVEFVGDSFSQAENVPEKSKFRKESLQVKIFKNPTVETCSPSLRKDLEDYKNRGDRQIDNDNKGLSPLIIIRENEEEEEKKN